MTDRDDIDWSDRLDELRRLLEEGALRGVYEAISVAPEQVLAQLRARGLPASDLDAVRRLPSADLDPVAEEAIARARRSAAAFGASFGLAGALAAVPAVGHLGIVLVRLGQSLSLIYGFDYRTQRGQIELWKALSRGLGVEPAAEDFEGTPGDVAARLPALVGRSATLANPLAVRLAHAVASRLLRAAPANVGRLVPVVGGGVGLVVSWRQVDRAGRRMQQHFRAAHDVASLDLSSAVEAEIVSG